MEEKIMGTSSLDDVGAFEEDSALDDTVEEFGLDSEDDE